MTAIGILFLLVGYAIVMWWGSPWANVHNAYDWVGGSIFYSGLALATTGALIKIWESFP